MSILKVARMGHPVLRAKAKPVPVGEIKSPNVQQLIDDMIETMREYSGIGLAGPQVHASLRVFVAGIRPEGAPAPAKDAEGHERPSPVMTIVNPEITLVGPATKEGWEGCLSIPDVRGLVPRAHEVKVKAYNRDGTKLEFSATGLAARVVQHETDHLNGILFFDRMPSLATLSYLDEYERFWRSDDD